MTAQELLSSIFDPLESIAGSAAGKLGLERYCGVLTTHPAALSVVGEGRDGRAVDCGTFPFSAELGAAVARFLEEGLKRTQNDEARALIADGLKTGQVSLLLFADPVAGRIRTWLVPRQKQSSQPVALFELRERPTQVH